MNPNAIHIMDPNIIQAMRKILDENQLEKELNERLNQFDKSIQAIRFSANNQLKLKVKGIKEKIPLSMFGDGLIKYLYIVSTFIANNAKTIYIDEVENGLHFSRMRLLLKNIIDFINNNKDGNLQVFMTTHNQEFIEILDQVIREKDFAHQTKLFCLEQYNGLIVAEPYYGENLSLYFKNSANLFGGKERLKKITMSKKTLIYTEGKSDKNFLSWCLNVWKNEDHFDQAYFDIIHVESKDKLFSDEFCKRIENILKNKNQEYRQVCIIFDADIKKEENRESDAGFNNKLKHIREKFKEKGTDFPKEQIFLFPNNQDDGDLETLLLKIAKHDEFLKCFEGYLECIKSKEYYKPIKNIRKNMLYAYLEALGLENLTKTNIDVFDSKGKIKSKYEENYKKLTEEVIDFSSNSLIPLKNFLGQFAK
ncbi:hypothetical protein HpDR25_01200 [Helicobacter pylori]